MKENADETVVTVYTVRAPCRLCGRLYLLPKGTKPMPAGIGPCCQLTLDALASHHVRETPAEERYDDEREQPPTPDLRDALCEGCRDTLADGVITPGLALCIDCVDELVEHWVAWMEDPSHDWWATDDVFGSVRYTPREWRATISDDGRLRL